MRSIVVPLLLLALGLGVGCASSPRQASRAAPQPALPDCEDTNGYPPCVYRGVTPYEGPYEGGGDYYPAYGYPSYPGTGVIVIPEPVPVPTLVPVPKPKPPKKPPPKRRPPPRVCHPEPNRPCPAPP